MENNKNIRSYNIGSSDYSKHKTQPWDMWEEYRMNPWDADIQKRLLRRKTEPGKTAKESRIEDYQKIIHICEKRIDMLKNSDYDDLDIALRQYIKEFGMDRLMDILTGKDIQMQEVDNIQTKEVDTIQEGDRFLCIQDVVMEGSGILAYKEGHTYMSECDGCITNECGYIEHVWLMDKVNEFFRKITRP